MYKTIFSWWCNSHHALGANIRLATQSGWHSISTIPHDVIISEFDLSLHRLISTSKWNLWSRSEYIEQRVKHPGLCGETRRNLFAISKDVECKVAKESRCLFSRLWNGGSLGHLDLGIKVIAASAEVFPLRFLNVRELRDASCLLFRKNPDSRISISRLKLRSLQLTRSLLDVHDQVTLKHSGKRQMETLN